LGDGDTLIDGLFDLTCTAMGDNCCFLYFRKTSNGDRLVWSTDNGRKVNEAILPLGTVSCVIDQLNKYFL